MYIAKANRADKIFDVFNVAIMSIILLLVAYPIYLVIIASFSDPQYFNSGQVLFLPKGIMFDGYIKVFQDNKIWTGYKNTIIYTALGTAINLCLTVTAGYCLSRKEFKGKKFFMMLFAFTMFFSGGMIPSYLLVKNLGIYNTIWAMVLPNAASVWNIIIARAFIMSNIPDELFEATSIDGGGSMRFFFSIVVPLSKALVAVLTLFYAVGHWNSFFNALIYLEKQEMYPLQLILRDILLVNQSAIAGTGDEKDIIMLQKLADLLKHSIIVVASLPVLCLYPFVQKYFVKGVMIGSIKG